MREKLNIIIEFHEWNSYNWSSRVKLHKFEMFEFIKIIR